MASERVWKSAVIGYGGAYNMGMAHARQMMEAGFEFAAACDLDPARAEQASQDFPGIRTYTDVAELLAQDDLDLVTVITPHNTHAELAKRILASGKHCIVEKPMCIHAEEADELVRLAAQKGLMLSVYHNRRWDDWFLTLQDLIGKGVLGDIFHVEMFFGSYQRPRDWWRSDKQLSGGAFYDWGAHYVDWLLRTVPGPIRSVRGFVQNRVWHETTNEDHIDCILSFENGAFAHVQQSSIARIGKAARRFLGTKGAVVDNGDGQLTLHTEENGVQVESKIPYVPSQPMAYYRNIADHLMNGAELEVKPEQTRRVIAVLETTGTSAEAGKELPVPYE
ncbi:Gfo/Idh/MocA family protein [Paenibacillus hodogayensis]|uniref:Gfo/Idh/MocA family protein n=1 Tax=Paenibacillus hodogayensis TaxID=279208 RepID=A0ABV5VW51_9BACL